MTGLETMMTLQNIRDSLGSVPTAFFLFVSDQAVDILSVGIPCFIYWCVSKKEGVFVFLNFISGSIAAQTLKSVFCVFRPWIRYPAVHPVKAALAGASGYSFPSGHAAVASSIFGGIALVRIRDRLVFTLCLLYIFLVCFSRCYLGVHMPEDVLAGCAVGFAVVLFNSRLLIWCGNSTRRALAVGIGYSALSFAVIYYSAVKHWPAVLINGKMPVSPDYFYHIACYMSGALNGLLSGAFLELRYIKSSIPRTAGARAGRFAAGLLLYLLLTAIGAKYGIPLVPKDLTAGLTSFAGGFTAMFYAAGAFPFICAAYSALRKRL